MKFRQFIQNEGAEIFGYESLETEAEKKQRSQNVEISDDSWPLPVVRFNSEYMTDLLARHNLGEKQPFKPYHDRVQWGEGVGAIRLRLGTKYDIIIERAHVDLKGRLHWIAKRLFNINREHYAGKEHDVADDLLKELQQVHETPSDSPNKEYKDFDRLVAAVARRTAIVVADPLFHEGVKKLDDNNYLIYFGCRGQGVQAPGQSRVEEAIIQLSFDPNQGTMKMIETNVESPIRQRTWALQPADFQLTFMPSQERDDIVRMLATMMKYF